MIVTFNVRYKIVTSNVRNKDDVFSLCGIEMNAGYQRQYLKTNANHWYVKRIAVFCGPLSTMLVVDLVSMEIIGEPQENKLEQPQR